MNVGECEDSEGFNEIFVLLNVELREDYGVGIVEGYFFEFGLGGRGLDFSFYRENGFWRSGEWRTFRAGGCYSSRLKREISRRSTHLVVGARTASSIRQWPFLMSIDWLDESQLSKRTSLTSRPLQALHHGA